MLTRGVRLWTDTLRKKKRGKTSNGARERLQFLTRAHLLVENAIKALMQLNGVDRDTAERAIRDIMGGA